MREWQCDSVDTWEMAMAAPRVKVGKISATYILRVITAAAAKPRAKNWVIITPDQREKVRVRALCGQSCSRLS